MPLYEKKCPKCHKLIEVLGSFMNVKKDRIKCCGVNMALIPSLTQIKHNNMKKLSMMDERYAEARRKECGVEV